MAQKVLKQNQQISKSPGSIHQDVYLLDENNRPYNYGPILKNALFKSINIFDAKNKTLIRKGIYAWKIIPVLQGNTLKIGIINFKITYRNRNYNFANGGGGEAIFEYSCDAKEWKFVKLNYQGL
jgi:hypothetical protein